MPVVFSGPELRISDSATRPNCAWLMPQMRSTISGV
jgi:hypothetical protein